MQENIHPQVGKQSKISSKWPLLSIINLFNIKEVLLGNALRNVYVMWDDGLRWGMVADGFTGLSQVLADCRISARLDVAW